MKHSAVREVAMREIRTRARTKAFRTVTLFMLLAAVAAPIIFGLMPDSDSGPRSVSVGIGSDAPAALSEQITLLSVDILEPRFVVTEKDQVDERLQSGDLDVAIEMPATLAWSDGIDSELASVITVALQQVAAIDRAEASGLGADQLADLLAPIQIDERFVDESDASEGLRSAVAFIGLFTAFLLPQVFGQLTMLSVVEEKSTRVVEVLLSHIKPSTLLTGKLLGLCALAVVQLALLVLGLVGSLLATDAVEIPRSIWQFVPILLLSVLGGLAMYTTVFALLGSLISRQEDASQVIMPVVLPLMAGYIVGQTAVFGSADSALVKALTWFPLTSPMLLPVRVAREAITPFEVVGSLIVLVVAVVMLVRLAGRVYEFTLLQIGTRVGWRELARLSRGAVID